MPRTSHAPRLPHPQVPVVVSNRIGTEQLPGGCVSLTFYGGSFIASPKGEVVAQVGVASALP